MLFSFLITDVLNKLTVFCKNPFLKIIVYSENCFFKGIASWGCTKVKLGLEPNDLLPDNSYGKRTLHMAEKYFSGEIHHILNTGLKSERPN